MKASEALQLTEDTRARFRARWDQCLAGALNDITRAAKAGLNSTDIVVNDEAKTGLSGYLCEQLTNLGYRTALKIEERSKGTWRAVRVSWGV